jgi:predicted  nucleic acid-binding Zn-ribbon protein
MSAIGRIFLVLNLILSALFVGWAANALSTSEEYKKQFDDEVAAHATTTSEAEASANDLRAELSTAKTRASVLQDESNDFENNATRLQGELDAAIARADSLGSDVSAIGSSVSDLNNTLGAVEAAKDNAVADAAQAKKEAGDAVDAKMAADSARIDAEDALDSANATIAALEVSLASSNASNSRLEATLATAVEEYGIPLSEITAQPDIRSTVLSVKKSGDIALVALNVGSDDAVTKGMTFEIWSGGQYKGQVRVESVMPGMCSALVTKSVGSTTISEGDHADTRL